MQVFKAYEVITGALIALGLQGVFFLLFSQGAAAEIPRQKEIIVPIQAAVEMPLLKLGSPEPKKQLLPQLKKNQPRAVKRYEKRAAPTTEAPREADEESIDTPLADQDHSPPPPDAEITKEVTQELLDEDQSPAPESEEQGAADGAADGTETDPLKARSVDIYRRKLASWFNQRFRPPTNDVSCEELRQLRVAVHVQVDATRRITGFSLASPSGNSAFDRSVNLLLQQIQGQQLPPPPPLYPDILGSTVYPVLSGDRGPCPAKPKPSSPAGSSTTSENNSTESQSKSETLDEAKVDQPPPASEETSP
ncbi:MAG: TonB C-terminal domain-containing protein [Polyangiaceae bacterium]|nr:TonB C-terminal domain-containing protein [Polyangiaceae bacterium]